MSWLETQLLVVDGVFEYRQLNVSQVIEGILVDIGQSDVKGSNDMLFNMLSKPSIVNKVYDFNLQGVEMVVHWQKEPLMKLQLRIKDFAGGHNEWIASHSYKDVMSIGEVLYLIDLYHYLSKWVLVCLIYIECRNQY